MSRDALIVGINQYSYLPMLKSPGKDAAGMAERLSSDGNFKTYPLPERVVMEAGRNRLAVSDTQPVTKRQLESALKQLFRPEGKQIPETALFFFSGHGLADLDGYDWGYLAASDTNPEDPSTGVSLRWLHWLLSQSPVRQQVVWLNCCHSGAVVSVKAANPGSAEGHQRCFIAASRDFERAWGSLNSPYSVLAEALLDGLDPARLPGGRVNSSDLMAYVVRALEGETQTPVCTISGEAIELTSLRQAAEPKAKAAAEDSGVCPYKGLEFFENNGEDPKYFFGRERLVDQLLDHVRTENFLALVGASGNGKSSVLRAGLLHQLEQGKRLAGSETWKILVTRPDEEPMRSLARAFVPEAGDALTRAGDLARAEVLLAEGREGLRRLVEAEESRVVLVIDQFEEVFTRCTKEEERLRFFECLMGALTEARGKLCLVIAMRADFVGKCLAREYAGLAQRVRGQMVPVLPLSADELEAAICEPARRVGLRVERELVQAIVKDTKDAPGSLPLLQYALKEIWQRRKEGVLQYADYMDLGGIEGTLDRRATEIYNSFKVTEQRTVRHIFQQLTQLGEGTEDTRRRVLLENLIAEPQHSVERVRAVVGRLASAENRLLVTSEMVRKGNALEEQPRQQQKRQLKQQAERETEREAIVDVSHEALIRYWGLLRRWMEESRDLLRQQRRIEQSSVVWRERGEQKGYLLQGLPLIEAVQFEKTQDEAFPLSEVAKGFVRKSVWQRRWGWLKTVSWLVIPAALVVGLVEYNVRESRVETNYARLDSGSKPLERRAAQDLVAGCAEKERYTILPSYFVNRLFGVCRTLKEIKLSEADLSDADLSSADLSSADLSSADLSSASLINADLDKAALSGTNLSRTNFDRAKLSRAFLVGADLSHAKLSVADLSSTVLIEANLSHADLRRANLNNAHLGDANLIRSNLGIADLDNANLSSTIFLSTDLRSVKNMTQEQLTIEPQPLICNSPLPEDIEIRSGINRDCDRIAEVMFEKYPEKYNTLEDAQRDVDAARERTWD